MKVSVSFLSSKKPLQDIKKIGATDANYIHIDFMDKTFTNYKSLSFRKIRKCLKYSSKRLDIHLMVDNPLKYIKDFATLNAEYITFPVEINRDIEKILRVIQSYGIKCGLAIEPDTDVEKIVPYLDIVDLVLVMGVNSGSGGQEFIQSTIEKIKKIKTEIEIKAGDAIISVDGGINNETKKALTDVDIIVSGSYVINSENFQERINELR